MEDNVKILYLWDKKADKMVRVIAIDEEELDSEHEISMIMGAITDVAKEMEHEKNCKECS